MNWQWLLAIYFCIEDKAYFGWNLSPKSDAELIADGICVLLFSLAFANR